MAMTYNLSPGDIAAVSSPTRRDPHCSRGSVKATTAGGSRRPLRSGSRESFAGVDNPTSPQPLDSMTAVSTPHRVALMLFAKPPIAGRSKTRLAESVGAANAALLAAAFLRDTVANLRDLPHTTLSLALTEPWSRYEAVDPALGAELGDLPRFDQGEGDRGARMERALRRGLEDADSAVILGADSPGLPRAHVEAALRNLQDADCVFGPALDGGYYLIGLRRCPEGCLANLPWSQSDTLQESLSRLFSLGFSPTVAPSFFDVNTRADLETFSEGVAAGLWRAPHTEAALQTMRDRATAGSSEIIGA